MKDLLVQINVLKANLKVKDERIIGIKEIDFIHVIFNYNLATEKELAALKRLSENRLEQLMKLKFEDNKSKCYT